MNKERNLSMKKKIFIALLAFLGTFFSITPKVNRVSAQEIATSKITVHYKRTDNNYSNWDFYTWNEEPGGGEAQAFHFSATDSYGKIAVVPLTGSYANMSKMGFIVRKGGTAWTDKDIATDRFLTIPQSCENGNYEVWLYQGLKGIFYSEDEAKNDKITSSIFTSLKTLRTKVMASTAVTSSQFHLYANDVELTNYQFSYSAGTITTTFSEYLPTNSAYRVAIDFTTGRREAKCTFSGIYDTAQFVNNYTYNGDDLGVTFDKTRGTTTFKLWAPLASTVVLNIYNTGTPKSLGGSDTPTKKFYMTALEKGVWAHTEPAIMHGCYYTYSVTNGDTTNETVDPYAKGCGINGLRGLVVDFDQINEQVQFKTGVRANQIRKTTDAIIYEMHVRDMTIDDTWGGKEEWRGKYLGLTQTGTKYQSVSTGLDHLKELGITHVQIMPTYDYSSVDETSNTGRNWGYDPLNYNCLEGSYSTDPYDGFSRIIEFKQMVKALTEAGIAINMDVVYNHTAKSANSNFDLIVPDYYHRMTEDGDFYNGSGCGNEMASQRTMVRKFILDSTKFWFEEYNLSGFRFDLMALIDTTTMGQVYQQLQKEYPQVMVYGEPWDGDGGGGSGRGYQQTRVNTISSIQGVGVFNDSIRDGLRGSTEGTDGAYVQNGSESIAKTKVMPGIAGYYPGYQNLEPGRMINYAACHDNLSLWDKISVSSSTSETQRVEMNKQADSILMFSEGIPFIQEGQEFLRTKPYMDASGRNIGGFDANSYASGDEVNAMHYDRKLQYNSVFNYYKDMIALRKEHNLFRLGTRSEINEALEYRYEGGNGIIAYVLSGEQDVNSQIYIVTNAGSATTYQLNYSGSWSVVFNKNGKQAPGAAVTSVNIGKNETIVLVNTKNAQPSYSDGAYQGVGTLDWSFTAPPIGGGTNGEYNPDLNIAGIDLYQIPSVSTLSTMFDTIEKYPTISFCAILAMSMGMIGFGCYVRRKRGC